MVTYEQYLEALKESTISPCYRVTILNEQNLLKRDVTNDVIAGSLSISTNSGQRRTGSLTISNQEDKYTNHQD